MLIRDLLVFLMWDGNREFNKQNLYFYRRTFSEGYWLIVKWYFGEPEEHINGSGWL